MAALTYPFYRWLAQHNLDEAQSHIQQVPAIIWQVTLIHCISYTQAEVQVHPRRNV